MKRNGHLFLYAVFGAVLPHRARDRDRLNGTNSRLTGYKMRPVLASRPEIQSPFSFPGEADGAIS
jgi:hypothetical protein